MSKGKQQGQVKKLNPGAKSKPEAELINNDNQMSVEESLGYLEFKVQNIVDLIEKANRGFIIIFRDEADQMIISGSYSQEDIRSILVHVLKHNFAELQPPVFENQSVPPTE